MQTNLEYDFFMFVLDQWYPNSSTSLNIPVLTLQNCDSLHPLYIICVHGIVPLFFAMSSYYITIFLVYEKEEN